MKTFAIWRWRHCTSLLPWFFLIQCTIAQLSPLEPDDPTFSSREAFSANRGSPVSDILSAHPDAIDPDERQRIIDSLDMDRDQTVSADEVNHGIRTGSMIDSSLRLLEVSPGQSLARFYLSSTSGAPASLQLLRGIQVKEVNPSIATASSQLLQAQAEGKADVQVHLATHGHQDLGSFVKSILGRKGAVELQIECSCHSAGVANFDVMLLFEGSTVLTPSFAFRKSCRSDVISGLDVGTVPHGSDAVMSGISRWLPSHMPLVNSNQSSILLYVTSRFTDFPGSGEQARSFQFPSIRLLGQKGIVETHIESPLGAEHGVLAVGKPSPVKVSFHCLKPALAALEIMLIPHHPWDPFKPVSIALEKDCRESFKSHRKIGTFQARARVRQTDAQAPVLIKSSFGESTSVFRGGRTLPAWETMNPSVSLAPENNVVVFSIEANTGMPTSSTLSILSPKVDVSNGRILEVVMSQEAENSNLRPVSFLGNSKSSPFVLIARHVCKDLGFAKVTVTLPMHKSSSGNSIDPVIFSYWKTCHRPIKSIGTHFLELQTFSQWDVPTGGWRTFLFFFIVIIFIVVCHEFGHVWLSRTLKHRFETVQGPELFGVKVTVGKLTFKPWAGAFYLQDLTLMNPEGYTGEVLMKAHQITMLVSARKAIFSFGHVAEIRSMMLKHVDIHVELDNLMNPFSGGSNMKAVADHAKRSIEEQAEKERKLKEQGVRVGFITQALEEYTHRAFTNAVLFEVELEDIQCTTSFVNYPSMGGAELNIEDIHYYNFSEEFDVQGFYAIISKLGEVVKNVVNKKFIGNTGQQMSDKVSAAKRKMRSLSGVSQESNGSRRGR